MTDKDAAIEAEFLGDMPPLNAALPRLPDRRQVSIRWLSGTVLVGLTSVFLMGGALFAALEGRQQLALPAQAYERAAAIQRLGDETARGDRPGINLNTEDSSSQVMMVSTVSREGDRDVVKVRPFLHIDTPLAIAPKSDLDYPAFDPMAVFSDTGSPAPEPEGTAADLIYGAEVESEVTIELADFNPADPLLSRTTRQRSSDITAMVRNAAPKLDSTSNSVAALSYFDPGRFSLDKNSFVGASGVTITAENVTFMSKAANLSTYEGLRYEESMVRIRTETSVSDALQGEGIDAEEAGLLQRVVSSDLGGTTLQPDDRLRLSLEIDGTKKTAKPHVRLASIYRNATHLVSVARTDDNRYVYAAEPAAIPLAPGDNTPQTVIGRMPTTYDAIYRASLTQGLNGRLSQALVRIFSSDVDFNAPISPGDELAVFVSLDENTKKPDDESEILYASITLGSVTRKYYRFRDPESGRNAYFDESGKSAKKFLLRQPVPGARFTSPFGRRWHPILKSSSMHWGVDWAAPRGTPILAAGDGVVEKAGWGKGTGRRVVLRHANGYETAYFHQTRIAKGIEPGARVRQGQVIGYVGSTGLSTGPHLHYEVHVNGTRVDPMRIRLPKGRVLEGNNLVAFSSERDRIDDLLTEDEDTRLARN